MKIKSLLVLLLLLNFVSCKKEGDYSTYLKQAEKIYPGRIDSIDVRAGFEKAQIEGLISADPRVVGLVIYWNSRRDSIRTTISSSEINGKKKILIPQIKEGVHTFEVISFDQNGNRSIASEKTALIYGPQYNDGLINRVIKSVLRSDNQLTLQWFTELDKDSPIYGVEIVYPDINGQFSKVVMEKGKDAIQLANIAHSGTIVYRTIYRPLNALELFYAKAAEFGFN